MIVGIFAKKQRDKKKRRKKRSKEEKENKIKRYNLNL